MYLYFTMYMIANIYVSFKKCTNTIITICMHKESEREKKFKKNIIFDLKSNIKLLISETTYNNFKLQRRINIHDKLSLFG